MIVAIDVGGTKVLVATFDSDGKVIDSKKFKTPTMYPDFIAELKKTVIELVGDQQPQACSIAMPGRVDRANNIVIAFGNLPWENIRVGDDLSDTITCPIYIENDANLAGLAEATSLLSTYRKTVYITVSTGIGGILVVDGIMDPELLDMEVGHMLFEHSGKLQRWEDFASGSAIVARTGKLASQLTDPADWYVVARNIAVGLINVIATLTPECIVFGGGVGSHLEKFQEKLHEELELYKDDMFELPQLVKAQHPEEAVVYGGYLLATQKLATDDQPS
jgi:predicted NBD/HSP70 family sugar kinase